MVTLITLEHPCALFTCIYIDYMYILVKPYRKTGYQKPFLYNFQF